MSLKEAAAEIGYSARSFARFIRSKSGVTPTSLRRRLHAEGVSPSVQQMNKKG
jgi:AraC-like DNA-binding protein